MNRRLKYDHVEFAQNGPTSPHVTAANTQREKGVSRKLDNNRLDVATMHFITKNMILRRAQYFGPGHWGVLLALAIAGESTFAQVSAWLTDDIGADISESTLRDSIKALEGRGLITVAGNSASSRGPKSARYAITELGRQQVERAPRAPIAHAG